MIYFRVSFQNSNGKKIWWVHKHEIENHPVIFSGSGQLFLPLTEQFLQQILYSNITHLALGSRA